MKNIIIPIEHFKNLIFEGVLQDLEYQAAGRHSTLLYAENWDNSLQKGVLIKRPAISAYYPSVDLQPLIFDDNANDYSVYMLSNESKDALVAHVTAIRITNPRDFLMHVLFYTRSTQSPGDEYLPVNHPLEAHTPFVGTGIVYNAFEYDNLGDPLVDYYENFKDEYEKPGWYVVGTYRDMTRYGQAILFTTLDDARNYAAGYAEYMYPVYSFRKWDIRKKRENGGNFWTGIEFNPLLNSETGKSKYSKWKVKSPSLEIKRFSCESVERTNNTIDSNADIQLMFSHGEYASFKAGRPDGNGGWDYSLGRSFNMGLGRMLPVNSETPTMFDYYPTKHIINSRAYQNYGSGHFWLHSLDVPRFPGYESFLISDMHTYAPSEIKPSTLEDLENFIVADTDYGGIVSSTFLSQDNQIIEEPFGIEGRVIGTWLLRDDNGPTNVFKPFTHIVPNYLNVNIPRPWYHGEKLPWIITGVVDGVEVIINRGEYEINSKRPTHYPLLPVSPFLSYYNINRTFGLDFRLESSKVGATMSNPEADDGEIETEKYTDFAISLKEHVHSPFLIGHNYANLLSTNFEIDARDTWQEAKGVNAAAMGIEGLTNFGFRIKQRVFDWALDNNVKSFKFYMSKPSETVSQLRSVNIYGPEQPPQMYMQPMVQKQQENEADEDFSQYALVKEFMVEGESNHLPEDQYFEYNGYHIPQNAWEDRSDGYIYATGSDTDNNPVQQRVFSHRHNDAGFENFNTEQKPFPEWYLWDYPQDRPPLTLANSGRYWNGKGAKCVEVIKGRTFIGGTINEEGIEEQSYVRYSAVQNGAASPDLFIEEHFVSVGHESITAFANFREQLWVFNENQFYRWELHNVYDESSWEFLEVIQEGTFSPKTLTVTPYGVAYCSNNGISLSNGGEPQSLTDSIDAGLGLNGLYQYLMKGVTYPYIHLHNPGEPNVSALLSEHNTRAELIYDSADNQLIFSVPVIKENTELWQRNGIGSSEEDAFSHMLRLIFDFDSKSWRSESYLIDDEDNVTREPIIGHSKYGRMLYDVNGVRGTLSLLEGFTTAETVSSVKINFTKKELRATNRQPLLRDYIFNYYKSIRTELYSHDIGDGINDSLLRRFVLEADIQNEGYFYEATTNPDPYLGYKLRDGNYVTDRGGDWQDIVNINMQVKGGINPFVNVQQTPGGISNDPSDTIKASESSVFLIPVNSKYRSVNIKLESIELVKLRSLQVFAATSNRRAF